jgi:hypothetical protein
MLTRRPRESPDVYEGQISLFPANHSQAINMRDRAEPQRTSALRY